MIHISIDYTGNIPGLGRGPFANIAISNTTYARLKAIGYPIKVLEANKIVKPTIIKNANVINTPAPKVMLSSKVEKEEPKKEEKPEINKITKVESAPKVVTPAAKPVEVKVEEPKVEAVVEPEVVKEEAKVLETKVLKVEDLDNMDKEELDKLLYVYITDRPSRYGKPWLIKKLKEFM